MVCSCEVARKNILTEAICNFAQELANSIEELRSHLLELDTSVVSKALETTALTELFEKTKSELVTKIWQNMQSSYKQSIQEVSQVLDFKIKFLKSMKS
eukprot:gene13851-15299_t